MHKPPPHVNLSDSKTVRKEVLAGSKPLSIVISLALTQRLLRLGRKEVLPAEDSATQIVTIDSSACR